MATRTEMREANRQREIAALALAIRAMQRHTPPVGSVQPSKRIPWQEAVKLMRRVKAQLESEGE